MTSRILLSLSSFILHRRSIMIFLSFSLLSARLFSRGDESYERVVAWRMGKKKKRKKGGGGRQQERS